MVVEASDVKVTDLKSSKPTNNSVKALVAMLDFRNLRSSKLSVFYIARSL